MTHLSKPLFTAGLFLALLAPIPSVRAGDYCGLSGSCSACGCSARGCGGHAHFEPWVTYYAPYPYWFPNYFAGPPYTSYLPVQYTTPPAESALIVKERILMINAANPALLPPLKEPLPFPKVEEREPAATLPK